MDSLLLFTITAESLRAARAGWKAIKSEREKEVVAALSLDKPDVKRDKCSLKSVVKISDCRLYNRGHKHVYTSPVKPGVRAHRSDLENGPPPKLMGN